MITLNQKQIFLSGVNNDIKEILSSKMGDSYTFSDLENLGDQRDELLSGNLLIGVDHQDEELVALCKRLNVLLILLDTNNTSSNLVDSNESHVIRISFSGLLEDNLDDLLGYIQVYSALLTKTEQISQELEMHKMQVQELTETNAHLITATFRERTLKKELAASNELIEEQQKKIMDSINYSLRIQQSIIPSNEAFDTSLGKHFVYYKPKDVVSGDFPWLHVKDSCTYFAAVDCTGHGVPGAMMSMIGNLLLNAIVEKGVECKTPAEILAELHRSVVSTLKQDAEGNKAADGMDAALCRIDFEKQELLFSGAHLPLLFLRNGELEVIKGDKFPVGGLQYRNRNTYSDTTIQLQKGDRIFIFSDGIIDQIGGPEKLKWMSASLKDFVLAHKDTPIEAIKEKIHEVFEAYKGELKQVDDVLLIGLEI